MKVQLKEIVSGDTAKWCILPYLDHPKGCPNYNKKKGCPPNTPNFEELIEWPFYLVYKKFDLGVQEKQMLLKHPDWSKRQARCCLYWQRGVVKELIDEAWGFLIELEYHTKNGYTVIENPEGAGIDLFKTCKLANIELERNYLNQSNVYKMVIIGKTVSLNRGKI